MEEFVILSSDSHVLRDNGEENERERESETYSFSEDNEIPNDLGSDDDDSFFSDTVEVGSYGDGVNSVGHFDDASKESEEDSDDLGGYDGNRRDSEDFAYSGDSDEANDSNGNDVSGEEYYETDSEDNNVDVSEARIFYSCPSCYMDIEVQALSIHLLQEHGVDMRNVACPICARHPDGDLFEHIMEHNSTKLKHKRKLLEQENSSSMVLGKELNSFLGYSGSTQTLPDLPSDVLDSQDVLIDEFSSVLNLSNAKSSEPIQDQAQKEEIARQRGKAAFVQELVASTML